MNTTYIPAITMLVAGLIDCIISINNKLDMLSFSKRLLFVLVIFYILGIGVKIVLDKTFPKEAEEEPEEGEALEEDEQSQDDGLENIDTEAVENRAETDSDVDDF